MFQVVFKIHFTEAFVWNGCVCAQGASGQRRSEELESQTACHSTPHWELGPLEEQEVVLTAEPSVRLSGWLDFTAVAPGL